MARIPAVTLILLYHRVAERETDPQKLCVSPNHFQQHLEVLSSLGTVSSLRRALDTPGGHQTVITFDDGYADNAELAVPALTKAEMPATIFITTNNVKAAKHFW